MTIEELNKIGIEISELFKKGSFIKIASDYGYALSFDKEPSQAIETDFESAFNESEGDISSSDLNVTSRYFEENETGLLASIECDFYLSNSTGVLVELILSENGKIYIEQISSYRGELNA